MHSRGILFLLLAAMPMVTVLPAMSGQAQDQSPTLAQQRAALERANALARDARKRSADFEARAKLAGAAADRNRDEAAALAARIQQTEAEIRASEARIALLAGQQRAQARRLAERQKPVTRLTASLQQIARRPPSLALLEPGSIDDAVHRRIILSQMLPVVMDRTRDLRAELARSAQLRQREEAAASQLKVQRSALVSQRRTLAVLEQKLRIAARQFHDTAGAEADRALGMAEEARDIGDLMRRVEASGAIRKALLALPGPTLRPANPQAAAVVTETLNSADPTKRLPDYRLPVVGDVVTGFGELSATGLRSQGIAIATSRSATVVAPANGRVAFAGPFRGYGRILIIEHDGNWTSLIANLGSVSAQVGDELRQGDPIGNAAEGERPRVMLELRQGADPVDIATLLR